MTESPRNSKRLVGYGLGRETIDCQVLLAKLARNPSPETRAIPQHVSRQLYRMVSASCEERKPGNHHAGGPLVHARLQFNDQLMDAVQGWLQVLPRKAKADTQMVIHTEVIPWSDEHALFGHQTPDQVF